MKTRVVTLYFIASGLTTEGLSVLYNYRDAGTGALIGGDDYTFIISGVHGVGLISAAVKALLSNRFG